MVQMLDNYDDTATSLLLREEIQVDKPLGWTIKNGIMRPRIETYEEFSLRAMECPETARYLKVKLGRESFLLNISYLEAAGRDGEKILNLDRIPTNEERVWEIKLPITVLEFLQVRRFFYCRKMYARDFGVKLFEFAYSFGLSQIFRACLFARIEEQFGPTVLPEKRLGLTLEQIITNPSFPFEQIKYPEQYMYHLAQLLARKFDTLHIKDFKMLEEHAEKLIDFLRVQECLGYFIWIASISHASKLQKYFLSKLICYYESFEEDEMLDMLQHFDWRDHSLIHEISSRDDIPNKMLKYIAITNGDFRRGSKKAVSKAIAFPQLQLCGLYDVLFHETPRKQPDRVILDPTGQRQEYKVYRLLHSYPEVLYYFTGEGLHSYLVLFLPHTIDRSDNSCASEQNMESPRFWPEISYFEMNCLCNGYDAPTVGWAQYLDPDESAIKNEICDTIKKMEIEDGICVSLMQGGEIEEWKSVHKDLCSLHISALFISDQYMARGESLGHLRLFNKFSSLKA